MLFRSLAETVSSSSDARSTSAEPETAVTTITITDVAHAAAYTPAASTSTSDDTIGTCSASSSSTASKASYASGSNSLLLARDQPAKSIGGIDSSDNNDELLLAIDPQWELKVHDEVTRARSLYRSAHQNQRYFTHHVYMCCDCMHAAHWRWYLVQR